MALIAVLGLDVLLTYIGPGSSLLPTFAIRNKANIPRQVQFSIDFEF